MTMFHGGDTITDGTHTGVIGVTEARLNLGGMSMEEVVYSLGDSLRDESVVKIRHEAATLVAYGRHEYQPHPSRSCKRCGVAKRNHGTGAAKVEDVPGPPAAAPPKANAYNPRAPLRNVATDPREVRSSFTGQPAYHYIRLSDALPQYDELDEEAGHTFETIVCKVKLFNPTGIGTWWIASYDPDTHNAWGVAEIHEREVGSFSMDELLSFKGLMGLPLERDIHWQPKTIAALLATARV